ncbi:hypothetical protein ACF0H5_018479 [Mactra antiquata]
MFVFVGFTLSILCDLTVIHASYTTECCGSIADSAADCKELCHKLSLNGNSVEQISLLASAWTVCPEDQAMEFWNCAEQYSPVLLELGTFSGRPCCNLTKTKACREACVKAQSEADVLTQCSHSTEDAKLFECIDRQRDGEKCCNKAVTTDSLTCKATCWNMYLTNTITDQDSKRNLRQHCTGRNKEVVQCLQKQTRTTRHSSNIKSLHCCENTNNDTCRKVCTESLRSENDPNDKIEEIISACGIVDLISPLYQCLLKEDKYADPEPVADIDSAKLHCCEKYVSKRCGGLCIKTHSWKWPSIRKFEEHCGYLSAPISMQETEMHSCLKDVEEPCQLGCSGLQYCTNMNNRPTEHFRSCTEEADNAAREDILTWQKGKIIVPNLSIPVKDIRSCEPEMWKAIACAYQIKPCYKKPSPPQICREDCVYIMSKCVDTSKSNMDADLCKRLPLKNSGECISVKQYTVESPHKYHQSEVTNPCKSNTCKADEVCVIRRRKCRHSKSCQHYVCRKGCKMGDISKVLVPYSTDVVIPVYKSGEVTSDTCLNYKVCHCSHNGNLGHCRNIKCLRVDHCVISTGVIDSGKHFKSVCNDCMCFGGEKICSKRQCPTAIEINKSEFTDVQNCKCTRKFEPVCASNGKTYPSACIARCAGQTYYSQGSCHIHNPCANNPCEANYRCVVNKQICYGHRNSPCLQYKCVALNDCNEHFHEPVCDNQGVEYTNDCLLLSKNKTIGYRGHCQVRPCSTKTPVCGHDGETYLSECAALASKITIDYNGPCKTFGFAFTSPNGLTSTKSLCENIACPAVTPAGCVGIIPPWSCCPVCAAELRLLVAEPLAHISIEVKKGPLTLNKILSSLSMMISVSECDVFGYLGLDDDIIVLVAPVTQYPTVLQMSACIKEAERLEYLIQSRNPSITSNMILTPLVYAKLQTPVISSTSRGSAFYTQPFIVIVTFVLIHLTHRFVTIV